ncbi:MAG TPA: hypothetical protein VFK37_09210 [Bacillales bacterium]|nr:hypothetical protein [Bacillales bacterium]
MDTLRGFRKPSSTPTTYNLMAAVYLKLIWNIEMEKISVGWWGMIPKFEVGGVQAARR